MKSVSTFRALSLKRIKAVLFPFSEVVSRQKKFLQVNFPLTLLVYRRKIGIIIKKIKMRWPIGHLSKTSKMLPQTQFHNVPTFHVRTTKQGNFIKV